jgi:hypothetical protein
MSKHVKKIICISGSQGPEQSLLMPGVGRKIVWGGGTKNVLTTYGGGLQKISKKVGGAPKIMYNNHKTSAITHC